MPTSGYDQEDIELEMRRIVAEARSHHAADPNVTDAGS